MSYILSWLIFCHVLYSLFTVEKPLYVEIAEWRKILARLTCFIQCVDYILQDLLRYLVFSAAEKLRNHLVTSYHAHHSEESNDENDDDFGGVSEKNAHIVNEETNILCIY